VSQLNREYWLDDLPADLRGGVVTIGNFDGVHLGHRRIVQAARALGDSCHAPVVAVTFEPPPDRVLRPADPPMRLTPPVVKAALLREAGADGVVTARVDAAFLALTAEEFVQRILVEKLAARHVVEGPDFSFGRRRAGNVEFLRQAGASAGFEVRVVEPATVELAGGPQRIASTLIRRRLAAGDVEEAARCLGRPFALFGRVVHGEGRGTSMGYPTVNLGAVDQILPAEGVYAGRALVGGRPHLAGISVGRRPTLGESPLAVEAFLLDARGDFYGQDLTLSFVRRLRGQQRFASVDALREQIARDVQRVRELTQQTWT